jgi:FkbM family methyltransferase
MGTMPAPSQQSADEKPFQHYSWKSRAIAWVSMNLFDGVVYRQRHGLLKGMRRRGGLGWLPISAEETPESRFWQSFDFRGKCVYDIGAFHGLLTMRFASQAKQVIAYEPNSRNRKRLQENLKLNNLTAIIRPLGLGSSTETRTLRVDPLMPGGSSFDSGMASGEQSESIQITTLDQDIRQHGLPDPEFMKVDVEGFEREVLLGARETIVRCRPELFLEMHGETMASKRRKVAEIVKLLEELGYTNILHIESGIAISAANSDRAAQGHLYCRP